MVGTERVFSSIPSTDDDSERWTPSADDAMYEYTPHGHFATIDPAQWEGIEPPEREWILNGWLPRRRAAYLTGAGGAGKSLLGQQMATCIAIGLPCLGVDTTQAPAIYLTAEDDGDELQRRQRAICRALSIREGDLGGKLFLVSLFGLSDNRMVGFDRDEGMQTLPAWSKLTNTARRAGARFIVLDNVSHVFDGSEIDRAQVTGFANLLNGLAQEIDGAVMLIGHPNKQGDAYSGSTAWENAFRARLYFDAPKGEHGHADPDLRQLTLPKANYARKGSAIEVRWLDGALVRDDEIGEGTYADLRTISVAQAEDAAFLRCLDKATDNRRAVSHVPGVNYAPKIFAGMIEGKRFDEAAFRRAMERLIHVGAIEFDQKLWKAENRHWKLGIRRVSEVAPTPAPTLAPSSCADPRQPPAQSSGNPCANPAPLVRQTHTTPYGGTGEPSWGDSPVPPDDELDWSTDEEGDEP
ncbi:AAA family ATPase [Novosphingobium sp. LASN5T]|uniref:AAA family ATPase n=1 Tax=Novosphingobium sp. LASN5T TaxID=2491021 RepID=UPI000F5F2572|nr:AAA family ATPase [Novosphingobium sp. LASN5T]RQW41370.1 AAA family ATPase [Novosphingobium sp. LASN5T]